MNHDKTHPRPQLMRRQWTDLCGTWQFAYDDNNVGLEQDWMQRGDVFDRDITVPFPPESAASGVADPGFHPVVWYRRTFQVAEDARQGRLLLHFGAVDYRATVWVNGRRVTEHEGGHTPFSADITQAVKEEAEEHVIVVRAEDSPTDLAQPRGKQDWQLEPHRIWYHRTTGIWQPVWLEPVGRTFIQDVRWTPDLDRGVLGMHVRLNTQPERPLQLQVRVTLRDTALVRDSYEFQTKTLRRDIALESGGMVMSREQVLWSPRYPNLLDVVLTLHDGDQIIDEVQSYAGMRSADFANGRFLLNGRPYYLRLVLQQGYWPESHLAAPSDEALRREVELIKSLGFNGVRIHQKVEDPRFLYWCDKLGLLVWGEMANAYIFSEEAVEQFTHEWTEVVRRDYSHPCIVTWVPLNESWGVPNLERDPAQRDYVRALYHLTRTLDPTRPVIGNDGWEHLAGDIWGVHDYALDGDTIRERYGSPEAVERTLREVQPHYRTIVLPDLHRKGEPIMLTECGGISYAPAEGEHWHGYGTVTDTGAYLAKYEELINAILDCPTIAGFCYTQLTDTEQETNGLLKADRSPKLDPDAVKAVTARPSKAVPGEILTIIQAAAEITQLQGSGD
jgi:beta-galactosidase/beta-glucuronidase